MLRLRAQPLARCALARMAQRSLCTAFVPPEPLISAEDMPKALRRRVATLETLHARFEQLEEQHEERLKQLDIEFAAQVTAIHERRQAIVEGLEEPTDAEVEDSAYFASIEDTMPAKDAPAPVGVPAFWPTVLQHCPSFEGIDDFEISEADHAVLAHLIELKAEPWEGEELLPEGFDADGLSTGFAMHFRFTPNPLLASEKLSIYVHADGSIGNADAPLWRDATADPTVEWVTKKVRKKGQTQTSKKQTARPVPSFFQIFSGANAPTAQGLDDEPSALEQLQMEILFRLKEDAIPRASIYYINALREHGTQTPALSPSSIARGAKPRIFPFLPIPSRRS